MSKTKIELTRGERTRALIIQAAHQLFIKQGYHGTSMRQIADHAGISLGAVYNHFSGKEDVFKAVYFSYHPYNELLPALTKAQGDTIELFLHDAFNRTISVLKGRPDFLNLMFIEIVEFNSSHAPELISTLLPQGMAIIHQVIEENPQRLRSIPPQMIIRTFVGWFFAFYFTDIIFTSSDLPSELHTDAQKHFIDIYLHGILDNTKKDV